MTELRLAVTGATGRMGGAVIEEALERDHEIVLAVARSAPSGNVRGIDVDSPADIQDRLETRQVDVLVDFTGPDSSVQYVEAAGESGVPAVVGTTGFSSEQLARVEAVADRIPVLRAPNFSRGVQALAAATRAALAALPGYDVEVTETHHNGKRDAPSGTANDLLETVEAVRGSANRVHGRFGETPREPGEIGVHARRAGDITGEHELLIAGNHEALTLTHRAGDRGVFAAGALDAAAWLVGRDPGYYDFSAVIDDT